MTSRHSFYTLQLTTTPKNYLSPSLYVSLCVCLCLLSCISISACVCVCLLVSVIVSLLLLFVRQRACVCACARVRRARVCSLPSFSSRICVYSCDLLFLFFPCAYFFTLPFRGPHVLTRAVRPSACLSTPERPALLPLQRHQRTGGQRATCMSACVGNRYNYTLTHLHVLRDHAIGDNSTIRQFIIFLFASAFSLVCVS